YVYQKLTFWSRLGLPNDLSSRSAQPFHLSDFQSHRKYGKTVGFYEGLKPCLSTIDPELIRAVLVTDFHKFANRRNATTHKDLLNSSLFFTKYPNWKRIRAILSPSFTTGKLKSFKPSFGQSLDVLIAKLKSEIKSNNTIDLRPIYDSFAFEVISKSAFGLNTDIINNAKHPVFEAAKSFFQTGFTVKTFLLFLFPQLAHYLDIHFFNEESQQIIANFIKQVINERIANNFEVKDLLQLSINASVFSPKVTTNSFEKLSEEELLAQSINFMAAGYDTTATQISFITQFLALNPNFQTKLVNEINSYFGDQSEVDYESVMKMPYLDAFFKEIMRFNCSVNRIDRIAENDCVLNGISIPKGTSIIIPVWALHLDADHYDEPNVFKPERFLPQNESRIKGYTYLPFASGPRNCIGRKFAEMEIKYFMVKILPLFEFKAFKALIEYLIAREVNCVLTAQTVENEFRVQLETQEISHFFRLNQ
ncbi:unnamed protein product, partial [Medioppia subpectinata]